MKLRIKASLFFGIFFLIVTLVIVGYVEYVVRDVFKKQTTNNFRIIAEQSKNTYLSFLEGMKSHAIDWTSDPIIQRITKEILKTTENSPERARLAKEFATYMVEKKMSYDNNVFLTDLLDKNGIVIASTNSTRIGKDELEEEEKIKAHNFSKTIVSKFSEVFVRSIIFEEDETTEPMSHATVRIFILNKNGVLEPLDAVLLIHFLNTKLIANALGGFNVQASPNTNRTFLENYKTSDIYLVNNEHLMVTPSRLVQKIDKNIKVNTLPVSECLENGKEISQEYDNYQGVRVLGASVCFKENGLILLVEVQKDEVFAPLSRLTTFTILGGLEIIILGILVVLFFIRQYIERIEGLVKVAKRVAEGDLDVRVDEQIRDDIGHLASIFNTMIISIGDARKKLEASKHSIEEESLLLEEDNKAYKKQQNLLEQSQKATMHITEDMWEIKNKFQAESNKLKTIISSVGDGIIFINMEYKIILVNPKILKFFEMSQEDIVGKNLRDVMKIWKGDEELPLINWPINEMFLTKSDVLTTIEDNLFLTTSQRENKLSVEFSIAPLEGGNSGGVIVIRDITSDRDLDEAKSGFISVASHQLRTPLTSIRWYSEILLSESVGTLNEEQKDFMNEVHSGAERLYQTVDLLLGISRVESGKIKAEKQSINLSTFTEEIVKELASQINEKGSKLSILPPEGNPLSVLLDPLTLRQVILNIFSNAIRYTNSKDGIIEVSWRRCEDGKEVIYSIRDNGIGIPNAVKGSIFSKFFRAENARTQAPDGSGLGLALVKEIVEAWGGKVWFETEEGKGTTFFFTVPLG